MLMTRRSALDAISDSTARIDEDGSDNMAEHRIRNNNIIYIIPDDDLFEKWKSDEAFIDDYGRLMNRKPHRVLKELKHYAENTPMMVQQRTVVSPTAPVRKSLLIKNYLKETVRHKAMETSEEFIDYAVDKFFYEVLPNVWHKHIVPFYHRTKEALTAKELKADSVLAQAKTSTAIEVKPKTVTKMTQEETDAEKRKVLYHWLGMLSSLKKLHDAGEIDIDTTLAQLTDSAMLERVNGFLTKNPNLLETDKYIVLHSLLGRNLYEEEQLVPIMGAEIATIAATYGYKKTEDNHNG